MSTASIKPKQPALITTVNVQDRTFHIHRESLVEHSQYFLRYFDNPSNDPCVIDLHNTTPDVFEVFAKYIYDARSLGDEEIDLKCRAYLMGIELGAPGFRKHLLDMIKSDLAHIDMETEKSMALLKIVYAQTSYGDELREVVRDLFLAMSVQQLASKSPEPSESRSQISALEDDQLSQQAAAPLTAKNLARLPTAADSAADTSTESLRSLSTGESANSSYSWTRDPPSEHSSPASPAHGIVMVQYPPSPASPALSIRTVQYSPSSSHDLPAQPTLGTHRNHQLGSRHRRTRPTVVSQASTERLEFARPFSPVGSVQAPPPPPPPPTAQWQMPIAPQQPPQIPQPNLYHAVPFNPPSAHQGGPVSSAYRHASPDWQLEPAQYMPNNPAYAPSNPQYMPTTPMYVSSNPQYMPTIPAYAPSNPHYMPVNRVYAPSAPQFALPGRQIANPTQPPMMMAVPHQPNSPGFVPVQQPQYAPASILQYVPVPAAPQEYQHPPPGPVYSPYGVYAVLADAGPQQPPIFYYDRA